jgi:4-hydroxy-3-polyprenylbenzoate decarboxylase
MMIDNYHLTGLVLPQQHLGMIWQEWEKIGEPMPYALVQGGDPELAVVGGMTLPAGADESAYLGALYGGPVEVVRCETNDLDVPYGAEVVIEGHLSVHRDATEGPFAEFHGWALAETSPRPVFSVEAVTYRDEPIWPLCAAGRQRASLPGLSSAGFIHRIGEVMNGCRVGRMCPATFVLDDDIDPADDSDLLWALGTRIHPARRQESWPGPIMPWYPCYTEEELHAGHGSIVVHDGLLPPVGAGRARPATFEGVYPPDIRARVLAAEADAR